MMVTKGDFVTLDFQDQYKSSGLSGRKTSIGGGLLEEGNLIPLFGDISVSHK